MSGNPTTALLPRPSMLVPANDHLDPDAGMPTADHHHRSIAAGIPADGSPTAGDP